MIKYIKDCLFVEWINPYPPMPPMPKAQDDRDILTRLVNASPIDSDQLRMLRYDAAEEISRLREVVSELVSGDVGHSTLAKLAEGQGTNTDDGRTWLLAAEIVKAQTDNDT